MVQTPPTRGWTLVEQGVTELIGADPVEPGVDRSGSYTSCPLTQQTPPTRG